MKRQMDEAFNREVENHRKALLYYARKCDWETFKAKAGRLFDYVESVEFRELERRFYSIFNLILGFLVLAVIGLMMVDFQVHQELLRFRNTFVVSALAVSGYELYLYLNYRMYIGSKTRCYGKRREKFIRNIERDFRGVAVREGRRAA